MSSLTLFHVRPVHNPQVVRQPSRCPPVVAAVGRAQVVHDTEDNAYDDDGTRYKDPHVAGERLERAEHLAVCVLESLHDQPRAVLHERLGEVDHRLALGRQTERPDTKVAVLIQKRGEMNPFKHMLENEK